jgi:hypothetical protein
MRLSRVVLPLRAARRSAAGVLACAALLCLLLCACPVVVCARSLSEYFASLPPGSLASLNSAPFVSMDPGKGASLKLAGLGLTSMGRGPDGLNQLVPMITASNNVYKIDLSNNSLTSLDLDAGGCQWCQGGGPFAGVRVTTLDVSYNQLSNDVFNITTDWPSPGMALSLVSINFNFNPLRSLPANFGNPMAWMKGATGGPNGLPSIYLRNCSLTGLPLKTQTFGRTWDTVDVSAQGTDAVHTREGMAGRLLIVESLLSLCFVFS